MRPSRIEIPRGYPHTAGVTCTDSMSEGSTTSCTEPKGHVFPPVGTELMANCDGTIYCATAAMDLDILTTAVILVSALYCIALGVNWMTGMQATTGVLPANTLGSMKVHGIGHPFLYSFPRAASTERAPTGLPRARTAFVAMRFVLLELDVAVGTGEE